MFVNFYIFQKYTNVCECVDKYKIIKHNTQTNITQIFIIYMHMCVCTIYILNVQNLWKFILAVS